MKGKTQKMVKRGSRKRSSSARSEKTERVGDRKNGKILCERPKPTVGCSANGRGRRRILIINNT